MKHGPIKIDSLDHNGWQVFMKVMHFVYNILFTSMDLRQSQVIIWLKCKILENCMKTLPCTRRHFLAWLTSVTLENVSRVVHRESTCWRLGGRMRQVLLTVAVWTGVNHGNRNECWSIVCGRRRRGRTAVREHGWTNFQTKTNIQ